MAYTPTYYSRGSVEPWDFIRQQGLNYHLGCAVKYICRAGYKDSKAEDLQKAIHYLENELQHTQRTLSGTKPDGNGGAVQSSVLTGVDITPYAEMFDR